MKKYFMKGTDDELQFGDEITLDLSKEMKSGKIKHHHLDCIFLPELVDMLLDSDIIEVREVDDPEDPLPFDFGNTEQAIAEMLDCYSTLDDKLAGILGEIIELKKLLMSYLETAKEPKKDAKKQTGK